MENKLEARVHSTAPKQPCFFLKKTNQNFLLPFPEFADCLCDLGRYREASTIYARVFGNRDSRIPSERLRHFIKVTEPLVLTSVDF
jgi:hypothetical protein